MQWELDWLLKMQGPNGGVAAIVGPQLSDIATPPNVRCCFDILGLPYFSYLTSL
jgi:hypothetical protein